MSRVQPVIRAHGIGVLLLTLLSCQPPAAAPAPEAPSRTSEQEAIQRDNDAAVRALTRTIAGHEQEKAGVVFTNVKYLEGVSAQTLLSIMNGGYAKALGVRCSHCHVQNDYGSDDKRPKRAAREMQVMHRAINQQLAGMQHISTPATANRAISCIACHRGQINPR